MNEKERLQLENELLMTCSKAQAINKYIDELEESSKLSELWCKSQQELTKYKERNEKVIIKIKELINRCLYEEDFCMEEYLLDEALKILEDKEKK